MKRGIFFTVLLLLACFLFSPSFAQHFALRQSSFAVSAPGTPALKWETKSIDAGTVELGKELVLTYRFVNEGSEAVKIFKVKPSCGCTGVDYSRELIAPGEEAFVSASYKAKHKGHFTKTVSVFTEEGGTPIILKFHGETVQAVE